eukprot:11873319-Karenia_brevis.AAC.1
MPYDYDDNGGDDDGDDEHDDDHDDDDGDDDDDDGEVVWESPDFGMFQTYRERTLNVHQTYARASPAFSSS